jgi:hypothetical protein
MEKMTLEERLVREYFPEIDDINQTEPIEVLPLTMEDMLIEYRDILLKYLSS